MGGRHSALHVLPRFGTKCITDSSADVSGCFASVWTEIKSVADQPTVSSFGHRSDHLGAEIGRQVCSHGTALAAFDHEHFEAPAPAVQQVIICFATGDAEDKNGYGWSSR